MKHTGSTLLILLFIGLSYFILPHSLQQFLPKKASADGTSQKITPIVIKPTPSPTPTISPTKGMQSPTSTPTKPTTPKP